MIFVICLCLQALLSDHHLADDFVYSEGSLFVFRLQLRPAEVTLLVPWRQMAALDYSVKAAERSCLLSVYYSDGCNYPNFP